MIRYLIIAVILTGIAGCNSTPDREPPSRENVHKIIDEWHDAAADAEFDRYFSYFTGDSAVFMGTDATERWTVAEFKPWSKPYFDKGTAWNFTPVERHINFAENGQTAWFDESLDTPNLGPARGSGVLIRQGNDWKIAHYNLSIPIPNSIVRDVVEQVEEVQSGETD